MPDQTNHSHHEQNVLEYFNTHKIQPHVPHEKITLGQRAADLVTHFCGSWRFIFIVISYIFIWIILNLYGWFKAWDPWPFIILNLTLSSLAALQAPIILMAQNREAERDRKRAAYDYYINRKAEREIALVQKELAHIKYILAHIYHKK